MIYELSLSEMVERMITFT